MIDRATIGASARRPLTIATALMLATTAWPALAQTGAQTGVPTPSSTSSTETAPAATQDGAGATQPTAIDDTAQAPADPSATGNEDIVVTGFRASLRDALNVKRNSNQIVDAITAEDIADFPDANLAKSIQRLPGISIDRDNGEGRSITVRGLGGDFQSVRLNGADAQNISGGNSSDAGANRSRGFDFNTFASELFGGIKIT